MPPRYVDAPTTIKCLFPLGCRDHEIVFLFCSTGTIALRFVDRVLVHDSIDRVPCVPTFALTPGDNEHDEGLTSFNNRECAS